MKPHPLLYPHLKMTDQKIHGSPIDSPAINKKPDLQEKIAFLRQVAAYPDHPSAIETVETHMFWVFLTDHHAYKLKKAVRFDYLDFSTLERRHRDCQEEVRLNRRLAGDVYQAVVPLSLDKEGKLHLEGKEVPVEWLVKMRRLPRTRMLDYALKHKRVTETDICRVTHALTDFYSHAPLVPITTYEYRQGFEQALCDNQEALLNSDYRLSSHQVISITDRLQGFLAQEKERFDTRARDKRIVDAHGDLRPEHICLIQPPVFIDCVEFNRNFRVLDPADELAYLAMECERVGAPFIGKVVFETYRQVTDDNPPLSLVQFHKALRAQLRAKLAIWHLRDCSVEEHYKWIQRAKRYLQIAEKYAGTL